MSPLLLFFSHLSYARWSNEALIVQHGEASEEFRRPFVEKLYEDIGYGEGGVGRIPFDIGMLLVLGTALRLFTLVALTLKKKL